MSRLLLPCGICAVSRARFNQKPLVRVLSEAVIAASLILAASIGRSSCSAHVLFTVVTGR